MSIQPKDFGALDKLKGLGMTQRLMIMSSLVVILFTAILLLFFVDLITETKLKQIKLLGESTTLTVNQIAVQSIENREAKELDKALNRLYENQLKEQTEFLQISVILLPSGHYFSSTNQNLQNKKVHPSLLKVIQENKVKKTKIDKFEQYRIGQKIIPVLQFLSNIVIEKEGQPITVGVTQVLYGYDGVVASTRSQIFWMGLIVLILINLVIFFVGRKESLGQNELKNAMKQIANNHFDQSVPPQGSADLRGLIATFNTMSKNLMDYFNNLQNSIVASTRKPVKSGKAELSFRKTEITCLCARMPEVQERIQKESSDQVADYIEEYLDLFSKIIREFGGQVVKIFGNKVYAVFEGMNSIDNSIRAAIKINNQWKSINHERKVLSRKLYDYGIGLHSTEGLAGTFDYDFSSYTFLGDSSTKAEHLCSIAKQEQILISSTMMEKSNGSYQHQILSEAPKSLFNEGEEIYSVLNLDQSGMDDDSEKARKGTSRSNKNFEGVSDNSGTSLPDMLEETLQSAPLEMFEEYTDDMNTALEKEGMAKERQAFLNTSAPKEMTKE